MPNKEWLSSLKAGDKVVVCIWRWTSTSYREKIVEKITPKGFIKVDDTLYYPKDGYARGGGSKILCPDDEDVRKKLESYQKESFVKNVLYKMRNVSIITLDQAIRINRILNEENGYE